MALQQKILIVDDNPQNLSVLRDTLEPMGYDLYFMSSGTKALEKTFDIQPDLIMLDIMMPEIDGFEVCRRLKEQQKTQDIPIIFLSGLTDAQIKVRAFEEGAVDYICKPFNCSEVAKRVQAHLLRSNMIAQMELLLKKAGHEFYTPLSVIDTSIKLQEMEFGESEYVHAIKAASKTLHGIYGDLLYAVRSQILTYDIQSVNLCAFIKDRIDYFAVIAKVKGIALVFLNYDDCFCRIDINAEELERIVDNTLSNAIKYGTEHSDVEISVEANKNEILLFVSNYAPPINDVQKIFDEYYRESSDGNGVGLGLDIVFRICKKYDIQISVESQNGKNTFLYKFRRES